MAVSLSGYVLASTYGGGSANYSYPLYVDLSAGVQDHFLNWKVLSSGPGPVQNIQQAQNREKGRAGLLCSLLRGQLHKLLQILGCLQRS